MRTRALASQIEMTTATQFEIQMTRRHISVIANHARKRPLFLASLANSSVSHEKFQTFFRKPIFSRPFYETSLFVS